MNSFFKTTSIYFLATIISSLIPFLLLPIMTRYLTQEEYGQVAMFQTLVVALSAITGLSVHGASNRKYFDNDASQSTLRAFNSSCIQILLLSVLFIGLAIYFFKNSLSCLLGIPDEWIPLALVISIGSFVSLIRLGQWQIRGKARHYAIFQISQSLLNMLFSIALVVVCLDGANGRVNAQVIVAIFFFVLALYLLYRDNLIHFFKWDSALIKEALAFGVPLVPHAIGGFLLLSVDRFIIKQELGIESVAIYMVGVQLSSVLKTIFLSINKAYMPWLFEKLKGGRAEDKITIVKMTYAYFLILSVMAFLAFIIGPFFVVLIAGESYREAGSIIGLLCLGNIFNGMYLMVTNYIFYSKKTSKLSVVTIVSGGLNVFLLVILIEPFGVIGASIAYAASGFIMFLFTWILAAKCYKMPWFNLSTS